MWTFSKGTDVETIGSTIVKMKEDYRCGNYWGHGSVGGLGHRYGSYCRVERGTNVVFICGH